MKATRASSLMIIMASLIFVGVEAPSWGFASGDITGVQVSQDGKQMKVESDGVVGRHKAFVMGHPNRLVIDFPENGLRGVPRKLGGIPGAREIRIGYFNSRARVVIDFGDSPVPPHRINHEGARVLVVLGTPIAAPPDGGRVKKPVPNLRPIASAQLYGAQGHQNGRKTPPVSIRSARVIDDLIVLELSDPKNPQRSCRVVMEMDMDRMRVVRTTLSDAKGNVKTGDAPYVRLNSAAPAQQGSTTPRGPRKQTQLSDQEVPRPPAFKWGLPEVKRIEPSPNRETARVPFQLERWVLKKRSETGG